VVEPDGALASSLLLETDPERRFSHVELSTAAGLLTLHPEGDGTIHGNAVTEREPGVSHVVGLAWGPADALVIDGSPLASAALAWAASATIEVGETAERSGLRIDRSLALAAGSFAVERLTSERWRIGPSVPFAIDADGLPRLEASRVWPLELDARLEGPDRG
jgi:hypothetical protein